MKHLSTTLLILAIIFTNSALSQSICDSIIVQDVQYDPLGGSNSIVVVAENHSTFLVSYPGFTLLSEAGDTVAMEVVNYFGMGSYPTGYTMGLQNGYPPSILENSDLLLFTGFYDSLICVYQFDTLKLCPPVCANLAVWVQGYGAPTTFHQYQYEVEDDSGNVVASSILQIDSGASWMSDSICLPPGSYKIRFEEDSAESNHLVKFRLHGPWSWTGEELTNDTNEIEWTFNVLEPCLNDTDTTVGFDEQSITEEAFSIESQNDHWLIQSLGSNPIQHVSVVNLEGRMVSQIEVDALQLQISTLDLPSGIYIIQVYGSGMYHTSKHVVMH